MHAPAIQGLHGAVRCTRIVVLDKAVVESLGLYTSPNRLATAKSANRGLAKTHVLIRDDLNALNMASGLKDLAQHILRDAGVQSSHVQRPLVRFRGCTASIGGSAGGRHDAALVSASTHGRGDGRRDGVVVLRDMERRRRHMRWIGTALPVFVAGCASVELRRRRELGALGGC